MVGIKRIKIVLGIFIPFCVFFLMSHNTSAVSLSGLNFLKVSYSLNGAAFQELIRHNTYVNLPDTLIAVPANASSERINYFVVSGNLPSSNSGSYFNGSINFEILANADNTFSSVNCNGVSGYIYPEQGTISESQSRSECNVSNNGRILNVSIITSGKLLSESTPTTWYSEVENNDNFLFSCSSAPGSFSAPCRQQELKINSATLNFNVTRDQTVAGLDNIINQNQTIINQNETIINNQNENTDAIINNQNQNTDAIIKSNQKCHMSNNLFDFINASPESVNGGTGSNNNGTYTVTASGGIWSGLRVRPQLEANTTYTFSALVKSTSSSSGSALFITRFTTENGQQILSNRVNSGERAVITFTTPSDLTSADIRFLPYESNATAVYTDIMLEKGSSATSYEPFGEEICKNINDEFYDQQRDATDNISNQSSSDIDGAENQATTNLIGVLGGFISAFSNISATNCNLTLEFPNYAGGTRVVNICSGKEKAPRIVEIGSSLLLIGVFVPLAYILIKMIYNEIRSWTNG